MTRLFVSSMAMVFFGVFGALIAAARANHLKSRVERCVIISCTILNSFSSASASITHRERTTRFSSRRIYEWRQEQIHDRSMPI